MKILLIKMLNMTFEFEFAEAEVQNEAKFSNCPIRVKKLSPEKLLPETGPQFNRRKIYSLKILLKTLPRVQLLKKCPR